MSGFANRRTLLTGVAVSAAGLGMAGCDKLNDDPKVQAKLKSAEGLTRRAQRLLIDRKALAKEFTAEHISKDFRANGSISPADEDYRTHLQAGFAQYALVIDGLVERPQKFTLDQIRAEAARTQITRHDCVEGWSSIAQWKGARLSPLLDKAGVKKEARYIVFHCFDTLEETLDGTGQYYESIDLVDAHHPQTILAYEMNGRTLPVAHGAPLRLRVERQLGYKQAKYISRIEAVASLKDLGRGAGGYWEDRGYEWYAGI